MSSNWRATKATCRSCVRRDAAHAGRGVLPPLLGQQEGLRWNGEGQRLPARVGEAAVAAAPGRPAARPRARAPGAGRKPRAARRPATPAAPG